MDRSTFTRRQLVGTNVERSTLSTRSQGYHKSVPMGVTGNAVQVAWWPALEPHALVVGSGGSGKTVLLQNTIDYLVVDGWDVSILAGRSGPGENAEARRSPQVRVAGGELADQLEVLQRVHDQMQERYRDLESGGLDMTALDPVLLVIDNYGQFLADLKYADAADPGAVDRHAVVSKQISSLVRTGRSARIHVLLSMQRPDPLMLGNGLLEDLAFRVSLGQLSPMASVLMWNDPSVNLDLDAAGPGRGMATGPTWGPVAIRVPGRGSDPLLREQKSAPR